MNSKLLTPLVTKGTQLPIFIVPALGTTPFSLIRLARSLKGGHPVYSFELPGAEDGLLPYNTIEEIAIAYLAEIKTVQATGPYYVAGNCGGAAIALEITKQIESQYHEVARLIILEAITPNRSSIAATGNKFDSTQESAPRERAMQTINEHISSQLALLPRNYAENFGKVSYHLLQMAGKYRAPQVKAPIGLIRTTTHPAILYEGWNTITTSGVEEHIVSGDAYSMLALPVVTILGEKLDQLLM